MAGNIFVVHDDQQIIELSEFGYSSEDVLQRLLADYPRLLAGDQVNAAEPRQWLLVKREAPVPAEEGGGGQWSLDHLFLDQDGVPTLVEVKRSSDTRSRREVVAQMLDYAANGTVYWPVERLQAWLEETCDTSGTTPDSALEELLGLDDTIDLFWQRVKTNLQAGRVRLVFVADQIASPLRRIVEFLNTQMDPAEVIAIEVRQFQSASIGIRVFVPRVIGQTEQAVARKGGAAATRQWDREQFVNAFRSDEFEADIATIEAVLAWTRDLSVRTQFKEYHGRGGCWISYPVDRRQSTLFSMKAPTDRPIATIEFGGMRRVPPLDKRSVRLELLNRLNAIPGIAISSDDVNKYPSIDLRLLRDNQVLEQFLAAFEWAITELEAAHE